MSVVQLCWMMLLVVTRLSTCRATEGTLAWANISHIAYELCPQNDFCERKVNNISNEDLGSCCGQCSCAEDCHIDQTCCPDVGTENYGGVSLRCQHQDEHFNSDRGVYPMLPEKYPSVYATETCSPEFSDEEVIADCRIPRTIRDHVYVTDRSTNLIYKNGKCALCNGVTDFMAWDLRVICPFNDDLYRADRQYSYLLEACSFFSVPTEGAMRSADIWKCPSNIRDVCNMTGKWDVYDPVLVKACATFNTPYLGSEKRFHIYLPPRLIPYLYQNVYCYLCNTNAQTRASETCDVWRPEDDMDRTVTADNFMTLLDVDAIEAMNDVDADEDICGINDIEDPLMNTCVNMLCPFGQVALKGRCESQMEQISVSLTAAFSFDYTLSEPTPLSPENVETLFDAIYKRVKKVFDEKSCRLCRLALLSNRLILLHVTPNRKCATEDLVGMFEHFPNGFRMQFNNTIVKIHIRLTSEFPFSSAYELLYLLALQGISEVRGFDIMDCSEGAVLYPKFYCRRITYSMNTLMTQGVHNETITQLRVYSEPAEYVNGSVASHVICLDDYMRIVNAANRISTMLSLFAVLVQVMTTILWL